MEILPMKTKTLAEEHFKYFCIHFNKFCLKMIGQILSSPAESEKNKNREETSNAQALAD